MTAFSRAVVETSSARFAMEIQSLNRRALEVSMILPPEFTRYDNEIRGWIKQNVDRGYLVVRLDVTFEDASPVQVKPNLKLATQLYEGRKEVAQKLGIEDPATALDWICQQEGVITFTKELDSDVDYLSALEDLTQTAVSDLISVKRTEGVAIEEDIRSRLQTLSANIDEIESYSEKSVENYREKLKKVLEDYVPSQTSEDERLLREICIYADKIDISEEITRFRSHIDQFTRFLGSNETSKGKSLDFVVQELNREMNTIGAKSPNLRVSELVVETKNELEKIREQTFNIE